MKTATFARPCSRRVLIADDRPTILHILTSVLKGEGYSVVAANGGREVFRILNSDCDFAAAILELDDAGVGRARPKVWRGSRTGAQAGARRAA